jgi:hypothetical protein
MALPVDSTAGSLLAGALASNSSRAVIDKASISNAAAGQYHSLWRATGQPAQGGIPAAAAICTNATVGALGFTQQTAPVTSYLGWANLVCSNTAPSVDLHDRLMHMGGLSGTVTTAQTVNLDLHANIATSNLDARKGDANYSDVSWWLEWYTDTGGTAVTATVNVTYDDGSSGNLSAISLAATRRASFMVNLNVFNPTAGLFIRDVNTVQLSVTTGTAGNFGVTCTRHRSTFNAILANKSEPMDWAQLGLPEIHNSSCLQLIMLASTTTTGTVRGQVKFPHV